MRRLLLLICLALALAGCGDRAKELYETGQLEEKQTNTQHAVELYREIVERFPDSPYAAEAKARLATLEP